MEDNVLFDFILAQAAGDEGSPAPAGDTGGAGESTGSTQESGSSNGNGDGTGEPARKQSPMDMLIPILLMVAVMYFFVFRGPKKRQNEQKKMMEELKKNDRIQTIGGIRGTIVDLRDDEVIIKIDESNNTKMRIARRAIATVMTDETPAS